MTAVLLPNGKQQFFDDNGDPLVGGLVYFYIPNTSTPKNTWQDAGQNTLNTNPVVLDSRGEAVIYGVGQYRQVLKDSLNNVIWDELTQDLLSLVNPNVGDSSILNNLCLNSDLSVSTGLALVRVGSPITISSFSDPGTNSGEARLNSSDAASGHANGLRPGKFILVEGSGTPHAPQTGLSGTVTSNNRLTCAASTFTGVAVGDVVFNTGGTNTSPKIQYRVTATNSSTYIELAGTSATQLVNETATFNFTWYQGGYGVNASVNGFPNTGNPHNVAIPGYPLKVVEVNNGSLIALLAGKVTTPAGSSAARGWEVTPGDNGYATGLAVDGWFKTTTLQYYRTYQYDWDGTTAITLPGCDFGCKVIKGSSGDEYFYTNLSAVNPTVFGVTDQAKLASLQGKTITFGMFWWPPDSSSARLYFYDGTDTTYSSYFTGGSFGWLELTVEVPDDATVVHVGVILTGASGATHYGTQPMAAYGDVIGEGNYVRSQGIQSFTSHPNFYQYYINGTITANAPIRIEQESICALPCGLKGLFVSFEGSNTIPYKPSNNIPGLLVCDTSAIRDIGLTMVQPQLNTIMQFSSGAQTVSAGTTRYLGSGNATTSEVGTGGPPGIISPFTGTINALYCNSAGGPGGSDTFVYTLRINQNNTSLTCTSTGAAAASQDTAHTAAVTAGNFLTVSVVASGTATATRHAANISMYITPTTVVTQTGFQTIGKTAEQVPGGLYTDTIYYTTGNAGWTGVNIDISACVLGG